MKRRVLLALAAGVVACVASVLAAVGPANVSRGVYRWPADAPAAGSSARLTASDGKVLVAPLLLSNHTPARLSAVVPCAVVQAADPLARERFTLLATANNVSSMSGLFLVVGGGSLRFGVGDTLLAEARWPGAALSGDCVVSAGFRGHEWDLRVGHREFKHGHHSPPVVTGLFTNLPRPMKGEGVAGLSVRVVTAADGSSPSSRQLLLTVVSIAASTTALVLLFGARRKRLRRTTPSGAHSVMGRLAWIDAAVGVALVAWWVFGPALWDDGWLLSAVLNFPKSGAFSNYYEIFNAQYPLGFLHFW